MKVTKEMIQDAGLYHAADLAIILDAFVNAEAIGKDMVAECANLGAKCTSIQIMLTALMAKIKDQQVRIDEVA